MHATIPKGIGMLSNLLLLLSFSTRRYMSMTSPAILSTIPFGVVACTLSDNHVLRETVTFCDNFLYHYSKDDVA